MNTRQEVRCYAVRRLNPFFGVLQVVETPTGRATTTNGLVWHIEVLSEKPADWGSLGSDVEDKTVRELVQRYIDWTAPSLLTLPYLEDSRRSRLESSLAEQALSVEYHWRLYPKILDESKLTAARVQAKLQNAGESTP